MNRNTIIALVAGLAAGMLMQYVRPPTALAQNRPPVQREVRAQSFTLVDSQDRPAGTFTVEDGPGVVSRAPDGQNVPLPLGQQRIILRDSRGRVIWSAGGPGLVPLSER